MQYYDFQFKLKFISGFIGVKQDEKNGFELSPMVGWVIGEQTKENLQTMKDVQSMLKDKKDLIPAK